jgi:hypothetical protein
MTILALILIGIMTVALVAFLAVLFHHLFVRKETKMREMF